MPGERRDNVEVGTHLTGVALQRTSNRSLRESTDLTDLPSKVTCACSPRKALGIGGVRPCVGWGQ